MGQNQWPILVIYFLYRYNNLKVCIAEPPSDPFNGDKGKVTKFSHLSNNDNISVMLTVLS